MGEREGSTHRPQERIHLPRLQHINPIRILPPRKHRVRILHIIHRIADVGELKGGFAAPPVGGETFVDEEGGHVGAGEVSRFGLGGSEWREGVRGVGRGGREGRTVSE